MHKYLFWIVISYLSVGPGYSNAFTVDAETNLRNFLLAPATYSTAVRPDATTTIELGINVFAINLVDLKNEIFSLSGWWSMRWSDNRLNWTGSPHTAIPVFQVYQSDVWTPALVVDNSVNDLSAIDESSIPLRVGTDGTVNWNPPGILMTSCEMEVTHFPFDTQTCQIQVTSFGYTIQELDIKVHSSGVNTKYYQPNGEWTLTNVWNERSEFEEDGFTYAKVTFFFTLERRAVYYGLNTMLPVLLNSLLIPLVFLLPHDSGEKIGYCLTVLLAYVVILTIVTDGLPTTAKTQSLLGVYIAIVLLMSGLTVAFSIHSLHLYHRPDSRRIPPWQVRLTRIVLAVMGKEGGNCNKDRVQDAPRSSVASPPSSKVQGDVKEKKGFDRHITSVSGIDADVGRPVTPSNKDDEMTWQKIAQVYDAFWLRVYFLIIVFSSVGFLIAIASDRF